MHLKSLLIKFWNMYRSHCFMLNTNLESDGKVFPVLDIKAYGRVENSPTHS
jgi:hypothetical protein